MTLRQPRSTLFPYTTLFRSIAGPLLGETELRMRMDVAADLGQLVEIVEDLGDHWHRGSGGLGSRGRKPPAYRLDRKSTRLNSSHRCISYAVFCLKKKKNIILIASVNAKQIQHLENLLTVVEQLLPTLIIFELYEILYR